MSLRPPPEDRDPDELLDFGVINLDKPAGPTSHQVSAWVGALTDRDRAGHVGTLDPAVTGCLPVLTGDATRLAGVLTRGQKSYVAILEAHDDLPTTWEDVLARFEGRLYQRPPRKSAVDRTLRVREINDLTLLERADRRLLLRIDCEAGTYIRKLCHDIGLVLGTGGHMAALRRRASEPFDDATVVTLHDVADAVGFLVEDDDPEPLNAVVSPAERALEHLPAVTIAPSAAESVATGAPIYAPGILAYDESLGQGEGNAPLVACFTPDGAGVCIGRFVGDPGADRGTAVELERVLV